MWWLPLEIILVPGMPDQETCLPDPSLLLVFFQAGPFAVYGFLTGLDWLVRLPLSEVGSRKGVCTTWFL